MKITLRQIFFVVLFLGLFIMTLRPVADPDFWWHLRTGQMIVQTRSIPRVDLFSFTKPGGIWITHEWLSEVLIYSIFRLGGFGLLIFTFSFIITAAYFLVYICCPYQSRPYVAGFVLLLGAISCAPTWGVRPQMITLLFFSSFLFLLERYRQNGEVRFLLPLPLIILVWVNMHAGYLLGIVLLGFHIVGGFLEMLFVELHIEVKSEKPTSLRNILILCSFMCLCGVGSLANPNGYHIWIYPFQTLSSRAMQEFIQEWSSIDFHQFMWQPFAFFILALLAGGMRGRKFISASSLLLMVVFCYAALYSMRNIPLFIVIAVPILVVQLDSLIKISPIQSLPRIPKLAGYILLICLLLISYLCFAQVVRQQTKTEIDNFPKTATDQLLDKKPTGNLFNSYGWGGYLIWRIYPEYQVYIDGRADVYGDQFIFEYLSIYRAEPGWEDKLTSYDIHTVLIESKSPLANMLRQSSSWRIVYEDRLSVLFTQ